MVQTYRPATLDFKNSTNPAYGILQGATWEFQINLKSGGNPLDLSAYSTIAPVCQMRTLPLPQSPNPAGTPYFTPVCTWVNALLGQFQIEISAATSSVKGWNQTASGLYHIEIYIGAPGPAQIVQRIMQGAWEMDPEFVVP